MSTMHKATVDTRVSVREVKEETYRALRAAGYPWGEAQAAGRLVALCQVLWGTGIDLAVSDATRRWVRRRSLQLKDEPSGTRLVDKRKCSDVITGNHAVAVALGRPGASVRVRGKGGSQEVAAAVWDLQLADSPMVWGRRSGTGYQGFGVDEDGHLYAHTDIPEDFIEGPLPRTDWFVRHASLPGGRLLMTTEHRQQCLQTAARHGVVVDPAKWSRLMDRARKFLVAE